MRVSVKDGGGRDPAFYFEGIDMFNILYHIFCETGFPVIALLSLGVVLGVLMLTEAER